MDNEYNLGNYIISNNFDEITYELNTNFYNNILYCHSNISPYSNLKYLNFNVVFTYNSIFNYKIAFYTVLANALQSGLNYGYKMWGAI